MDSVKKTNLIRYYFFITFLKDQKNNELLASRCIDELHWLIARDKPSRVGVSFPSWSKESVGDKIAFVSIDESRLLSLRNIDYFHDMSDDGNFLISDIHTVPEGLPEVQFRKNKRIEKIFEGGQRRRAERAAKRAKISGRVYKAPKKFDRRCEDHFHKLKRVSLSTGHPHPLYIQKYSKADIPKCDFDHFGFATNELYSGTVPDLFFDQ